MKLSDDIKISLELLSFLILSELLVCLLVAESVKALCGKQITPYLLNKAFLAKSVNQNPRNRHKQA